VNEIEGQSAPENSSPVPLHDETGTEVTAPAPAPVEPAPTNTAQPIARITYASHEPDPGWMGTIQSLMATVVIAVFVITFIVQAFQIPSESMQNTLLIGDYLLVDKEHYGPGGSWHWLIPYQKIKFGDIIVFRYPLNPAQHFVKRVIGVPGDHIRLLNKQVFVNGHPLKEPYVVHSERVIRSFRDNFPEGDRAPEHLNWRWSEQIDRLTEEGQLIVPDGYYFAMGDNRDESSDSRYWGFVPKENIIGRPLFIYWSVQERNPSEVDVEDDQPGDKLTRLTSRVSRSWKSMRWKRMFTLIR
jgi:signal peptidase I